MEATIASIVAAAAPLVYAVVGETIAEKAGVINLSLDGSIMLSAMTGFAAAYVTGSALVGFLAAIAVSAGVAALIAFASIELRLNQIAVGFVLTLLAADLSAFLGNSYVGLQGEQVPAWAIPGLSEIPFLGEVLFNHNLSVYGSFLVVIAAYLFLYRTRRGLELQGIGERPESEPTGRSSDQGVVPSPSSSAVDRLPCQPAPSGGSKVMRCCPGWAPWP